MVAALVGLVGFVSCMLVSASVYPGGTWLDRRHPGFSFWYNYWCDLLSPVALNGQPNLLGSWLGRVGFAAFAISLWRFWPMAREMAGRGKAARAAAGLGGLGALALIAVSAVPSTISESLHAVAVSVSAGSSIVAAVLVIPSLWRNGDQPARWLGALVTLSCSVTLLQYLRQGILRDYYADWLPGAQKVATVLLLLWMLRLWWLHARTTPSGSLSENAEG